MPLEPFVAAISSFPLPWAERLGVRNPPIGLEAKSNSVGCRGREGAAASKF